MPFITQAKTNWKFLLIVIVLAVTIAGGILWCQKTSDGWQTYRNEEYGFEIKYPQEYFLRDIADWEGKPTGSLLLGKTEKVLNKKWPEWLIDVRNRRAIAEEDRLASFEEFAERHIKLLCDADGVSGTVYCTDVVKKEPIITVQGITGYEFYITEVSEIYDVNGREVSERIKGPIFFLDISQYTDLSRGMSFSLTALGEENREDNLKTLKDILSSLRFIEKPAPKEPVIEEQVTEVKLSSNLKLIQAKKDEQWVQAYTIEDWQEWAKDNWESFIPESIIIADIVTQPKDFSYFTKAELIPRENKILFVPEVYRALSTFSAVSILDFKTNEVSVINATWGSVGDIVWSPDRNYLAYTLGSARAGGERLSVDDFIQKSNIFMLDGAKIIQPLGLEIEPGHHFLPEFRNIDWSPDSQKIYFTTNARTTKFFEKMGEARWIINVDGTGLEKIEGIIIEEEIRISDILSEEIIGKIEKDPEFADWFADWQATNPLLSIDDFLILGPYPHEESMWARFIAREEENVNVLCPEWASKIISQPREIYSPDKTKYIYFPCVYGQADTELWLYNRKDDKKMERIGFSGPSGGFNGAFWINDERFVVLGVIIMTPEKHSIYISYWDLTDEQRIMFEITELNPRN